MKSEIIYRKFNAYGNETSLWCAFKSINYIDKTIQGEEGKKRLK